MTAFIQFAIVGLGLGCAYALFAQGAVLIYRGSGIVNFGHGAVGMLAAYVTFGTFQSLPVFVSVPAGLLAAVATGLLFDAAILRRLSDASPVTRLIATLGLLLVVQSGLELRFGNGNRFIEPFLPHDTFRWGAIRVQEQVLYIMAITLGVTGVLWLGTRSTRLGLAIRAAAENQRAVQTLGWSPQRLGAITWGVGSGVAGLAGILVAPLTGLSPSGFTLVMTLAALAAAVLGQFRSFPGTLLGGMVVGLGEAMVTLYRTNIERFLHQASIPGLSRSVPFVLILLALVIRGRGLPLRSHVLDRLPQLGTGKVNPVALIVAVGGATAVLFGVFDDRWAAASFVSLSSGVVVLSIVVLTGFAGQLSLAQWTLAGIGALVASVLVGRAGWPLELAMPVGALLTIPAGLLFALPALRTRGVNLAVVTLGLGYTVRSLVFSNGTTIGAWLGGGRRIERIELFGVAVDSIRYPHRWAGVCLVVFVLAALMVANVRRSRVGRRLIAVRTNERAAASLGISVFGVKLYAFGLASALAGLGGILVRFQYSVMTYEAFDTFASIKAVGYAVIGGLGYVIGPALSSVNAVGGIGTLLLEDVFGVGEWEGFLAGGLLLVVLVADQNGLASFVRRGSGVVRAFAAGGDGHREPDRPDAPETLAHHELVAATPVVSQRLEVSGLTVRFGAVTAVQDVSFIVEPGEVVGLIGPNGAGKTTIIDAVTGFVAPTGGHVSLGDRSITSWGATRRAASGLRRSFQSLELFEDLRVEENVRCGSERLPATAWITDVFWPGRKGTSTEATAAMQRFGLIEDSERLPADLSQGRRRYVAIARAIASGPSIVMLDEPAAGLDDHESRELARLIRALADERRMGVLLVEHDVAMVLATCDRVIVIDFGVIIAEGTPDDVRNDPAVRAAYLGAGLF